LQELGLYERAKDLYTIARHVSREAGMKIEELEATEEIGVCYMHMKSYGDSIKAYQDAVEIAQDLDEGLDRNRAQARCLCALGLSLFKSGDKANATKQFEAALVVATEKGYEDKTSECNILACLGHALNSMGQFTRTIHMQTRVLELSRQINDTTSQVRAYGNLGIAHRFLGHYDLALTNLENCLRLSTQIGNERMAETAYCNLGNLFTSVGDHDKAIVKFKIAITTAKRIHDRPGEGRGYMCLAECFLHLQQYEQAVERLEWACAICREDKDDMGLAACTMQMGACYVCMAVKEQGKEERELAASKAKEQFAIVLQLAETNEHRTVKNIKLQVYLELSKLSYLQGIPEDGVYYLEKYLDLVVKIGRTLCTGCGQTRGDDQMFTCGHCKVARYCCKEHQRQSWISDGHKVCV
jgi:tetratricopeptide (TPR) repeat protein